MKPNWETISTGLDQLFFITPLLEDETIQDRADTIDLYLQANGWTWDEVIAETAKEPT